MTRTLQESMNILAGTTDEETIVAANTLAGLTGQPLIVALNEINGTSAAPLPFRAVCNALAGTTGMDGTGALSALAESGPFGGGGFAPTDIASLVYWMDADQIAQADDTDVASFPDHSGNANTGTLTGTAAKLRTAITPGGANIVRFVGLSYYTLPDIMIAGGPGEMMVVLKKDDGQNGSWAFTPTGDQSYYTYSGSVYEAFGGNQVNFAPTMTISDGTFHVYDVWRATGDHSIVMDGVSQFATGSAAPVWRTAPVIGNAMAFDFDFRGDIAEICVFTEKLSTENRAAMLAYLQAKHGI